MYCPNSSQPENLYYIDVDNLNLFLGAAAINPDTPEVKEERGSKKKFNFKKWLKKEQAAIKKAKQQQGNL